MIGETEPPRAHLISQAELMNKDITDPAVKNELLRLNSLDYGTILCNMKDTIEANFNEQTA